MGEPEPEPEDSGAMSPQSPGGKKPKKKKEPAGQAELRQTIKALQVELAATEAGSEQNNEILTLIQNLQSQLGEGRPSSPTGAGQVGMSIMVAGKLKRKKKKPKKKKKGFFDDSYMAKEKRAAEVAAHIKLGDELLEKADAATDAELAQAEASFRSVLELESQNIHARVAVKKAASAMEKRAEERKAERKKVLMQKRYGDNWATEMGCEQTCTDKDLREVFDLVDVDGGGTLDRDEVGTLADFFGDVSMTDEQIDEAMSEMDDDNSGEVDFEEFLEWYHSRDARRIAKEEAEKKAKEEEEAKKNDALARTITKPMERTGDVDVDDPAFEEKLHQIFDRYDDDGSGEIDAEELGQIFAALGQPMEEEALLKLVEEIDEDGSGMIEFDEFLQMVKSTGGGAAAVLREQAFGEMDAEERHMWARGKILRFPDGTFHSVFTKDDYDKLLDAGCLEPGAMSSAEFTDKDPRMSPRQKLERTNSRDMMTPR